MTEEKESEKLEAAFRLAGSGDADAFAEWMKMVEESLRRSLARFARAVDVEVVVQETFLRMWQAAGDPLRQLTGENASLRFALRVAANVAHEELRRMHLHPSVSEKTPDELPDMSFTPVLPDPALRRAIVECMDRLPAQPKIALKTRIQDGHLPDRDLAQQVRMKRNTFLQNIVRARKLMAQCLEKRGVRLGEMLS